MVYTGIVKYHVKLSFEVDGLVEKADIIGAIFGQTEGLLGPEMNLNELQKMSKVGRIEVNTTASSTKTKGDALIPMSTDINTAALIAAAIESIDKVGPFRANFKLEAIDDVRSAKKKEIVDRAKAIVQKWSTKTISEGEEMLKDVSDVTSSGKLAAPGRVPGRPWGWGVRCIRTRSVTIAPLRCRKLRRCCRNSAEKPSRWPADKA